MPKATVTNEQIAGAIVQVLRQESIDPEQLKQRTPKGFWEKVRQALGDDSPEKGTISSRWNRSGSGTQLYALVNSLFHGEQACPQDTDDVTGASTDRTVPDPHLVEACPEVGTETLQDLDPSMVVSLDAEDLVSLGVMTEPIDSLDTTLLDTSDLVDLYMRDATTTVDTVDIETETWTGEPSHVSEDESLIVAGRLEESLKTRLANFARELEIKLTRLVQIAAQVAVQDAIAEQKAVPQRGLFPQCPVPDDTLSDQESTSVELKVLVDTNLLELFESDCRLNYSNNATRALNTILWHHYGKPKLSFDPEVKDSPRTIPSD